MHPFAHYALVAAIVLSAAGAFLLCLLVGKYGFPTPAEETADVALRRLFVTRLGHAAAAVCFVMTGALAAVALSAQLRAAPAPATPPKAADPGAARAAAAEVSRLSAREAALSERLAALEERVRQSEGSMSQVASEQDRMLARMGELERARHAARTTASRTSPPSIPRRAVNAVQEPTKAVSRPSASNPSPTQGGAWPRTVPPSSSATLPASSSPTQQAVFPPVAPSSSGP